MARKLILDVDTGTDDAVAIMLAALHPDLDLVGVTTVNGNAPVQYCTDNTLRVLDHIGHSTIPVFEGASQPIVRSDFPIPRSIDDLAGKIHGKTLPLPDARSRKADKHAVEFLVETFRETTDEITLVPVAPLTNIAAALSIYPGLVDRVPEIVIMGGGHEIGNITPSAEFNIWGDPEAAAKVFAAGFRKMTLVPLDATHKALVSLDDCAHFRRLNTPAASATAAVVEQRIGVHDKIQKMAQAGSAPVHDALCIAYLLDRTVLATRECHVDVETHGTLTVGRTVIDTHRRSGNAPNCNVAFDADPRRFVDILIDTFSER